MTNLVKALLASSTVALAAMALSGCDDKPQPAGPEPTAASPAAPTAAAAASAKAEALSGNAERGHALVKEYECNRCHDGTGYEPMAREKHCFSCHQDILDNKFDAPAAHLAKWKKNVEHLRDAPSLAGSSKRYEPTWLASFLQKPTDLRPHLASSMPRLKLTDEQARDIAAYLTKERQAAPAEDPLAGANLAKGRKLLEQKGCGGCHTMTGVKPLPTQPQPETDKERRRAITLAPDLRFARERFPAQHLMDWLRDPTAIKPDTLMPKTLLTQAEARDLAAYLLKTPLQAAPKKPVPERLPILERKVTFDEVEEKVIGKTCRHCHSEPDIALGDGGPGNTGGFGFKPRKLNMGSYSTLLAGYVDDGGERTSVFSKTKGGTPRLVAALIARQQEEAGEINPEVRGMPLGLPALSPEEIQLVETWVAQGRRR